MLSNILIFRPQQSSRKKRENRRKCNNEIKDELLKSLVEGELNLWSDNRRNCERIREKY